MRLALFDLDHTLLSADSDVLWCEFLIAEGRLGAEFAEQYQAIAQGYDTGTITPVDYCGFHAATLAGYSPAELLPLREHFFQHCIQPRIPDDARELLQSCHRRGETLVLTTATAWADPPPWMPAAPPPPTERTEHEVRKLRHEAAAYGAIGLAFIAGGIAVDVVALDLPQAEQATRRTDGTVVVEKVRGDANWAELAGGIALTATGLVLAVVALSRLRQARRLAAQE